MISAEIVINTKDDCDMKHLKHEARPAFTERAPEPDPEIESESAAEPIEEAEPDFSPATIDETEQDFYTEPDEGMDPEFYAATDEASEAEYAFEPESPFESEDAVGSEDSSDTPDEDPYDDAPRGGWFLRVAEGFGRRDQRRPAPPAPSRYYQYNAVVSYYLLMMLGAFTLFLSRDNYSNVRHDKFYLYLLLSGGLIVAALIEYISCCLQVNRYAKKIDRVFLPFTAVDGAFACFLFFAWISTAGSAYGDKPYLAEMGRNNGLLLLIFYALVYLIVSRMYVYKDYVIATFLITSCIVALLTMLNFFYIDPLALLKNYDAKTAEDFGSTIGNKNTIASYMAMFLPIAIMTLVLNQKHYMRAIAVIAIPMAYMGALSANSSSVFLGLSVALPVMMIFCAQRYDTLMNFMIALTLMFAGGGMLRLFSFSWEDKHKGFEELQQYLIYDNNMFIPLILCGAIAVAMFIFRDRAEQYYPAKVVTIVLISLTALAVFGAVGLVIYYSVYDTTTPLGSLEKMLRFNDAWGTHRGIMWIRSMWEYNDFDVFNKLFGAGPDMAFYVLQPHFSDLVRYGNNMTNCAHNEYINYLITQGALGLLSYLAILGTVSVRAFRRAKQNPVMLIFISAVICYAVQSIVNIYQPITTPLFFLFISMAEALNRQTPLEKTKKQR